MYNVYIYKADLADFHRAEKNLNKLSCIPPKVVLPEHLTDVAVEAKVAEHIGHLVLELVEARLGLLVLKDRVELADEAEGFFLGLLVADGRVGGVGLEEARGPVGAGFGGVPGLPLGLGTLLRRGKTRGEQERASRKKQPGNMRSNNKFWIPPPLQITRTLRII